MVRVFSHGLTPTNVKRLTLLSLFWHFLDVIWIFIFTIVYLMGAIGV
jgi:cytochrome o ubiquinol oxidase subunit 3